MPDPVEELGSEVVWCSHHDATLHCLTARPAPSRADETLAWSSRDYNFLRRHKQGGLGSVWVVFDERAGREVALKRLRGDVEDDPVAEQLIRNEARVTAQLQHPNIVPVYDLGLDERNRFYYTMRLVNGRTLSEKIDDYTMNRSSPQLNRVNLYRLLAVFRGVCNAVSYAHSKGFVHLDLKPSNVLVGEFGEAILLDWGCAKPCGETASGSPDGDDASVDKILGTPAYMAPEQIPGRRRDICFATDIYQLGAILYEVLTGHPPHAQHSLTGVLRRSRSDDVGVPWAVQAKRINPAVPPALAAICERALSDDQKKRYQTVSELWHDVERWMADEPVSAYRAGPVSTALRWVRHHQKLTTVAVASLSLLVLFNGQLLRLTVQDYCNKLAQSLVRETRVSVGAVDAIHSLFETHVDVSREEFNVFASVYLSRGEHLAALEWIPAVRHAERASYEQAVRDSAWPSPEVAERFRFNERAPDGRLVESSSRDIYFPVYYLAPYVGNESAFGYDLGACLDRLETLQTASETGSMTITSPIELVQGARGFLALAPVARDPASSTVDDPRGYVLGVFKADRLITSAWRGIDLERFSIRVYDNTEAPEVRLVWSNSTDAESASPVTPDKVGLWGASRELSLWNRKWIVVVQPRLSFVLRYPFSRPAGSSDPL